MLFRLALLFRVCWFFHEALGVEVCSVGTPDRGVGVDDERGHLDDGVFFQEVVIVEDGVFHYFSDGGVEGVDAEDFLEMGD